MCEGRIVGRSRTWTVAWVLCSVMPAASGCFGPPGPDGPPTSTTPRPPLILGAPSFSDVTLVAGLSGCTAGDASPSATWADYDNDTDPDLLVTCASGDRLFGNDGGRFFDATTVAGLGGPGSNAAAWADFDNDRCLDLFLARESGPNRLLRNRCDGTFADATSAAGVAGWGRSLSAAWADFDRDADMDLFVATRMNETGELRPPLLYENRNGKFVDVAASARLLRAPPVPPGDARGALWADFGGDSNPELLILLGRASTPFFRNLGDSTFQDQSHLAGLDRTTAAYGADAVDYDHDGLVDVALATDYGIQLFRNRGDGGFDEATRTSGLQDPTPRRAVTFADLNNDGWEDLLAATPDSVRVHLNRGAGAFEDVTAMTGVGGVSNLSALAVADVDGDGDLDVLVAGGGGLRLFRNDGPAFGPKGSWIQFRLAGNQSNAFGVGARLNLWENGLLITRQARAGAVALSGHDATLHVGLGRPEGTIDLVEIAWPSGFHQVITAIDVNVTVHVVESPSSKTSCPLLFHRVGDEVRFVSDVAGNAYTGWLVAPGFHHPPDPTELDRVDGLTANDGVYEIRLIEALQETDYVDEVQLVAVDHPVGVDVIPDERFQVFPPYPDFGLVPLVAPRPVASARDGDGRDVTALVLERDRQYPAVPALLSPRFEGYAQEHVLHLDLGDVAGAQRLRLAAWGWIYYPMVTPQLVMEGPYVAPMPPRLEARDPATGGWVLVAQDIGFPAGLPKWWTYDLTGRLPAGATEVRLTTNLRVYWDQILVDTAPVAFDLDVQRLSPSAADLHFRGYPQFTSPDGLQPPVYDYEAMTPIHVWRTMAGAYTRFGDVTELLSRRDDRFVIFTHGEEVTIQFRAADLRPARAGYERTFFVWFDLFTKDMEPYNAFPETVEPLPFHAMSNYPYGPSEAYPQDVEHQAYRAAYNTRLRP